MSFIAYLEMIISIVSGLLAGISGNEKYAQLSAPILRALKELQAAHNEVITAEHLESLRTEPKW